MKTSSRSLGVAALLLGLGGPAGAHLPDYLAPRTLESRSQPQVLVQEFLAAVDRGELCVLGTKIERGMLTPRRVEYVYDLQLRRSTVKVYADLQPPLPLTGQEPCKVHGVNVLLDEDGAIVESEAHVWCH
ncbi:MAG: hypothetical protein RLZ44_1419 [Pseudomonadota bacterium]